mmetsp:Transcript_5769/g.12128  ORF Transcript_5769/g.12128 Transcript_5769/m.12128 type:complete len:221 (-) Transcript_5769:325-987(-)
MPAEIWSVRNTVADLKTTTSRRSEEQPDDRGGRWWSNDTFELPVGKSKDFVNGATTEKLAPKPTYFSVLYTHQLFGHLSPWGTTCSKLAPPNSNRGYQEVSAEARNMSRVYGGPPGSDGLPQWGVLGPGANAIHPGGAQLAERTRGRVYLHPASPSAHCQPTPDLPEIASIRAKTSAVPKSIHPLERLPSHTAHRAQIDARLYGSRPRLMTFTSRSTEAA